MGRIFVVILIALSSVAWGEPVHACAPPAGFRDGPHPAISPPEQLVSHSEEILISRPLAVRASLCSPLTRRPAH